MSAAVGGGGPCGGKHIVIVYKHIHVYIRLTFQKSFSSRSSCAMSSEKVQSKAMKLVYMCVYIYTNTWVFYIGFVDLPEELLEPLVVRHIEREEGAVRADHHRSVGAQPTCRGKGRDIYLDIDIDVNM